MSRSSRQNVRLIQELVRLVQSGRLSARWLIGLVVLAAAYLLLQPMLERSLGIDLPGLSDLPSLVSDTSSPKRPSQQQPESPATGELGKILSGGSRHTYQSPAGLRYTRGSQHGHRLKHLMAHTVDQPDRPGQHGVFDTADSEEVVALVDEAYRQALAGKDVRVEHEHERTIYTVNLGRPIGYIGGESGNRRNHPAARHLRLVVEGQDFITAFPYRP